MAILRRGHPHRTYGQKDETWPWRQPPYDPQSHRTFGRKKPTED
jgi:hypothetical protein